MISPEPSYLPRFDPAMPAEARVFNRFSGGKDNFAPDRALAELALEIAPEIMVLIRELRKFTDRAVRFLVEAGVQQFIDVGGGIPAPHSLHEVVRPIAPDAKVACVDIDPVVVTHGRALAEVHDSVRYVQADARDPDQMLDHPELVQLIDLDRPVAILMQSLLAVITEDDLATTMVRRTVDRLPSGCGYLLISHPIGDVRPEITAALADLFQDQGVIKSKRRGNARSRKEVERFMDGLQPVPPGMVPLPDWRPGPGEPTVDTTGFWVIGGIGRKP
ncbi:SAM-dependent methyltransferase [Actinomadura craniellae]|uniref:SAM-dependent methyltransferase n=1 Tax=Actinomadura craniellae TaxID=2231787 RepID=A0A365HF11_9ACTN|nr:SAM-dependent methyltransferase [Actinomadura craniellae]RAY16763.1 SAM-dependent methyltransferase [Actinomadura craniellae]